MRGLIWIFSALIADSSLVWGWIKSNSALSNLSTTMASCDFDHCDQSDGDFWNIVAELGFQESLLAECTRV
jgi:hypothetical protein